MIGFCGQSVDGHILSILSIMVPMVSIPRVLSWFFFLRFGSLFFDFYSDRFSLADHLIGLELFVHYQYFTIPTDHFLPFVSRHGDHRRTRLDITYA